MTGWKGDFRARGWGGVGRIVAGVFFWFAGGCGYPRYCPREVVFSGERLELPMILDGRPYVSMVGGGKGDAALFLIDTGMENIVLSPGMLGGLKTYKHPVRSFTVFDINGVPAEIRESTHVEELNVAGLRIRDFDVEVRKEEVYADSERAVAGVLGLAVFEGFLTTLDFPNRRVVLAHGELPAADGKTILNYRISAGGQPEVEFFIDGEAYWGNVDTGSAYVIVPEKVGRKWRFSEEPRLDSYVVGGHGKAASLASATLAGKIRVGEHEWAGQRIALSAEARAVWLGADFLSGFCVTIDSVRHRLRLVRGGALGLVP